MQTFLTLLAKDLREQRFTLLATLGAGAALTAIGAFLLDATILDSDVFARVTTMSLGGLAALAVGCDLGSRDRAEGSQSWVLRQPFGLPLVVASKLATLLIAIAAGLLGGAALAFGTSSLLGNGEALLAGTLGEGLAILTVISAGLWSSAASAWLPRGFLAAPGGLVAFLTCASPAWFPMVWYELFPDRTIGATLLFGLVVGGLLAFVAGMLFRMRSTESLPQRAGASLAAGSVAMLPLWFTAGTATADVLRHDVDTDLLTVRRAYISRDGQTALVTASEYVSDWRGRDISQQVYAVDVDSGEWRPVGAHGQWMERGADSPDGSVAGVILRDHEGGQGALDGQGNPIQIEQLGEIQYEPDIDVPAGYKPLVPEGAGWILVRDGQPAWWEPATGTLLTHARLQLIDPSFDLYAAWWTGERWLLRQRTQQPGASAFYRFDPRAESLEAVDWLTDWRDLIAVLHDGRIVYATPEDDSITLRVFDDATDASTPLEIEGFEQARFAAAKRQSHSGRAPTDWQASRVRLTDETEERLLVVDTDRGKLRARLSGPVREGGAVLAGRVDADTYLVTTGEYVRRRPYGRAMSRATLLQEGSDLVRVHLDGRESKVLFPPTRE